MKEQTKNERKKKGTTYKPETYQKNKKSMDAAHKRYVEKNREKINIYVNNWLKEHPEAKKPLTEEQKQKYRDRERRPEVREKRYQKYLEYKQTEKYKEYRRKVNEKAKEKRRLIKEEKLKLKKEEAMNKLIAKSFKEFEKSDIPVEVFVERLKKESDKL